jgi:glycosyltransferase involved in cell wall biosynthesis
MNLYLTADQIGTPTGGGLVTAQELMALRGLGGEVRVISRKELEDIRYSEMGMRLPVGGEWKEPWAWDSLAFFQFDKNIKLAHVYSGTFSESVKKLKENKAKVVYTIAAHSIETSRREHEKLGIDYAGLYPHLCEPVLWERYSAGYFAADCIVCPSTYSMDTVQAQAKALGVVCPPVSVIPHGCHLPDTVKPLSKRFTVGYLGAFGPDKGVIYLLQAWKKLNYKDALLILAGRDSTSDWVQQMVRQLGGGNVMLQGWVNSVSSFYNQLSLYVQPSATEGFGIEVLEAMAHSRPVICSNGAGAADLFIPRENQVVTACDVDELVGRIDEAKNVWDLSQYGEDNRKVASALTWDKIREKYVQLYREVLS